MTSERSTLRSAGTERGMSAPAYSNAAGRGTGRAGYRPSPMSSRVILPDDGRASAERSSNVPLRRRAAFGTSAGRTAASMRSSRVTSGADAFPRGSTPASGAATSPMQSTLMALRIVRSQICLQDRPAVRAGADGSGCTGMPAVHDCSYSVGRADDGWLVGMRLLPAKGAPRFAELRFWANVRRKRSWSAIRRQSEPSATHGNKPGRGVLT
jgi:hypothetical protein